VSNAQIARPSSIGPYTLEDCFKGIPAWLDPIDSSTRGTARNPHRGGVRTPGRLPKLYSRVARALIADSKPALFYRPMAPPAAVLSVNHLSGAKT